MNVSEMIDELASRLEDLDKKEFTDSFKLLTLNNAQDKLANLLDNKYLTELEYKESVDHSGGMIEMDGSGSNSTAYKVLRGAEGVLRVGRNSDGVFATRIDITDLKKKENTFYAASSQNPLYYIFQNKVYVLPTSETTWDLYYLKTPTTLLHKFTITEHSTPSTTTFLVDDDQGLEDDADDDDYYNDSVIYSISQGSYHVVTDYDAIGAVPGTDDRAFTVSPAAASNFATGDTIYFLTHDFDLLNLSGVTCDLNESLHELIVTFAEAECWKMTGKLDRSKAALEMALLDVKTLNDRFKVEAGMGIGSKNRNRQ